MAAGMRRWRAPTSSSPSPRPGPRPTPTSCVGSRAAGSGWPARTCRARSRTPSPQSTSAARPASSTGPRRWPSRPGSFWPAAGSRRRMTPSPTCSGCWPPAGPFPPRPTGRAPWPSSSTPAAGAPSWPASSPEPHRDTVAPGGGGHHRRGVRARRRHLRRHRLPPRRGLQPPPGRPAAPVRRPPCRRRRPAPACCRLPPPGPGHCPPPRGRGADRQVHLVRLEPHVRGRRPPGVVLGPARRAYGVTGDLAAASRALECAART